jgi:hypothetical protein
LCFLVGICLIVPSLEVVNGLLEVSFIVERVSTELKRFGLLDLDIRSFNESTVVSKYDPPKHIDYL